MVQMRNLAESFNEKSLPCVKGGGFAEQTRRDCNCKSKNTSLKVKVANDNPSVLLRSTGQIVKQVQHHKKLQKEISNLSICEVLN